MKYGNARGVKFCLERISYIHRGVSRTFIGGFQFHIIEIITIMRLYVTCMNQEKGHCHTWQKMLVQSKSSDFYLCAWTNFNKTRHKYSLFRGGGEGFRYKIQVPFAKVTYRGQRLDKNMSHCSHIFTNKFFTNKFCDRRFM